MSVRTWSQHDQDNIHQSSKGGSSSIAFLLTIKLKCPIRHIVPHAGEKIHSMGAVRDACSVGIPCLGKTSESLGLGQRVFSLQLCYHTSGAADAPFPLHLHFQPKQFKDHIDRALCPCAHARRPDVDLHASAWTTDKHDITVTNQRR